MSRRALHIVSIVALAALISCKPQVPDQFIQPDEMEDILYDYHIAQAMAINEREVDELQRDYKRTLYFAAVLEKHGVTRAEFDSSLVYYYTRADRFVDIYKEVSKRLSDAALDLGASDGEVNRFMTLNANGDTANVWMGNLSAILKPYVPYNRMDFYQKADTSYRKGDSFMFGFTANFFYQTGTKDAVAYIAVKYDNDSIVSQVAHIHSSGDSRLRIPEMADHKAKEIRGFIFLGSSNDDSNALKMMVIKNLQLVRFHKENKDAEQKETNSSTPTPDTDSGIRAVDRRDSIRRDSGEVLPPARRISPNRMVGRNN